MRIHSDTLQASNVYEALQDARKRYVDSSVFLEHVTLHGSRKRTRGIDVALASTGNDTHRWRRNVGPNGDRTADYAATYADWGWFILELFNVDPDAIVGPYSGLTDFHNQTHGAFADDGL